MSNQDEGSRRYVFLICGIAALGGLLFGYDTAVINGAIGFIETHFELTPAMKGWAASSALLGCVIGVSFAGAFSDWLGRKKTLVLAGLLFLVSSIGTAVPQTLTQLVIFRILAGVGVGVASIASPMYIAEITPAAIRGRMVSLNQFAIVSGMLIIYFVNYFIARAGDPAWQVTTSWRWMFASGTLPSAIFLGLLLLAPESPRWLIKQGRHELANRILARIGGSQFAAQESRAIRDTIAHESGSLKQLLEPGFRRVLVIGIALAVLQQITGINVFLYFGAEIFKQLGHQRGHSVAGADYRGRGEPALHDRGHLDRRPPRAPAFDALWRSGDGSVSHRHGNNRPNGSCRLLGSCADARIYRLLCSIRRTRHLGHTFGNISHSYPRPCTFARNLLVMDRQLHRLTNFSDDGGAELMVRSQLQSRLPILFVRSFLRCTRARRLEVGA